MCLSPSYTDTMRLINLNTWWQTTAAPSVMCLEVFTCTLCARIAATHHSWCCAEQCCHRPIGSYVMVCFWRNSMWDLNSTNEAYATITVHKSRRFGSTHKNIKLHYKNHTKIPNYDWAEPTRTAAPCPFAAELGSERRVVYFLNVLFVKNEFTSEERNATYCI